MTVALSHFKEARMRKVFFGFVLAAAGLAATVVSVFADGIGSGP